MNRIDTIEGTTKKEDTKMTAKDVKLENEKNQREARALLEANGQKQCTICSKVLSLDEFHKDSQKKDGHSSWCKSCTKIKATQAAVQSKVTRKAAPVTPKAEAKDEKAEAKRAERNAKARARRAAAKATS